MQAAPTRFTGCADGLHVLRSAGPIAVKAAVLTIVEKMHAKGIGMLYAGWPTDSAQVSSSEAYMSHLQGLLQAVGGPADLPAGSWHCQHQHFLLCCVQVAYIIATIVALDYLHDCWFYWTHRWLHSRLLYKRIHAQHHM